MTFLSKETSVKILESAEDVCVAKHKSVPSIAALYKENGYSYIRFIWVMWDVIPLSIRNKILRENNPDLKMVGGYWVDLKDSHIETMLKAAFRNVAPAW